MKLYTYFRSSAAYRVRIALGLKGVGYDSLPVHLLRDGGEQHRDAYLALNPQGLVPVLEEDGRVLTQSLAIIEYLEETHPAPALLPSDPVERARVRALAQAVACDIHPLNNLRVLRYLVRTLGVSEEQKNAWYRHWIETGLPALESMLAGHPATGRFCHGDTPGLADCVLVPQLFNARRFQIDLAPYPTLTRIDEACAALPAFQAAHPDNQPDAV
ncbi:maleylacetoacetate isomerase [Telmatospirillum sp. J64-1]|uniref:maleylacetoacetate isomerase n=1 Tax=Telmatospirillum sp. J64-1 TaxID=2502183 RepID=UPI00115C7F96|nr:maleylacetoacetate isomerase [Telmatospirillum sp. J64-1]